MPFGGRRNGGRFQGTGERVAAAAAGADDDDDDDDTVYMYIYGAFKVILAIYIIITNPTPTILRPSTLA